MNPEEAEAKSNYIRYIAVDFDATIARYEGWKGKGVFGQPMPGAKEAMMKFAKTPGVAVIVYTTRLEIDQIREYLRMHEIPYDYINYSPLTHELDLHPSKIMAHCYVDDRGLRFEGTWSPRFVEEVLGFKSYYEKQREAEATIVGRRKL
jgi:hypothetical protein